MTYELIVKPEAEADIEESFIWYEDRAVGLGQDFRNELRRTIFRIKSSPLSFPKVHKFTRRALVDRFPHAFFFLVEDNKVFITACVHQKRNPEVWKQRR